MTFYARVLGSFGGRRQFLARLGTEVSDILDEFLTFALDHETSGLPGLQSFISTLELEAPTVKREQDKDRNEVRIMTVHASKGLEAPIVFLVDGGGKAFTHTHLPKLRLIETGKNEIPLPVWVPVSALANSLTEADTDRLQTAGGRGISPPALCRHDACRRPADHLRLSRHPRKRRYMACYDFRGAAPGRRALHSCQFLRTGR